MTTKKKRRTGGCPKPSQPIAPFDELADAHKTWPSNEAVALCRVAAKAVSKLQHRADAGDKTAASLLLNFLHKAVWWINRADTPGGVLVRSLAPACPLWPTLANLHPQRMS